MKIDGFQVPQTTPHTIGQPAAAGNFIDTLKAALHETDQALKSAESAGVELAEGRTESIHDAMITMQKADISLRLMVATTNKLVEGYNELMRIR